MQYFLSEELNPFINRIKDKSLVMLLGPTGVGKSTLGTALANFLKTNGKIGVDTEGHIKDNMEVFKQSSLADSETYRPQEAYIESMESFLIDNPGFNENRGLILNLFQTKTFKKILKLGNNFRFVIVLSHPSFQALRSQSIKNFFNFLKVVFGKKFLKDHH